MKSNATTSASLAITVIFAATLLIMQSTTSANASNETGIAIATEVDNRDKGWGDVTVEGEMVLKNKAGKESVRGFRSTILEASSAGEGDQSIITFSKPRDVGAQRC
jgi:hypothetical protein